MTLYFVCLKCEDKFLMDENYVEIANDASTNGDTQRADLTYQGRDCLCPICGHFSGKLVELS